MWKIWIYHNVKPIDSKEIKGLHVYCLDTHLDPHLDSMWTPSVPSTLNCLQTIPKNKVDQHVAQECTKRPLYLFQMAYLHVIFHHFTLTTHPTHIGTLQGYILALWQVCVYYLLVGGFEAAVLASAAVWDVMVSSLERTRMNMPDRTARNTSP